MRIRQGDVMLVRVKSVPRGAKLMAENHAVLAEGEVTGHAHRVEVAGLKMYEDETGIYVDIPETALLRHDEHSPIPLERGIYRLIRQREYEPQGVRNIAD